MTLRRLVYASWARVESATQVRVLVGQAQVRNRQRDVTGALGYTGPHFIQALEGYPAALSQVIASIERDARHTGIKILADTPVDHRLFGRWNMHLVESLDAADSIEAMLQSDRPADPAHLRALFRQIATSLN